MRVLPAILVADRETYLSQLRMVRQMTDRFQLDIIDGSYVDNKTISLEEIEPPNDIKMDLDLMVAEPQGAASRAIRLKPNLIIFHYESGHGVWPAIERVLKSGLKPGIAIDPKTKVEQIKDLIEVVHHVLIMGYPAGFAGQPFQPGALRKVKEVRALKPGVEIGLDGGVNAETIEQIAKADVDVVNANTAIFGQPDPLTAYMHLMGAVN